MNSGKKSNTKYVFLTALPSVIVFGITIFLSVMVSVFYGFKAMSDAHSLNELTEALTTPGSALMLKIVFMSNLVYCLVTIPLFAIWYYRLIGKKLHIEAEGVELSLSRRAARKTTSNPLIFIVGMILLAISSQFMCAYLSNALAVMYPEWAMRYETLLEANGLADNIPAAMAVIVFFFGPIGEEYAFRGVTMHYAQKSMSIKMAVVVQALFFAAMHMNMLQSCYAFVMGVVLGYLMEIYGKIWVPIFAHMLFNVSSLVMSAGIVPDMVSPFLFFAGFFVSMCLVYISLLILKKVSVKEVNKIEGTTDMNSEGTST